MSKVTYGKGGVKQGPDACRDTLQSELNRIRQEAEKDRSIEASVRYYLRQEPGAVVPHAGIWGEAVFA